MKSLFSLSSSSSSLSRIIIVVAVTALAISCRETYSAVTDTTPPTLTCEKLFNVSECTSCEKTVVGLNSDQLYTCSSTSIIYKNESSPSLYREALDRTCRSGCDFNMLTQIREQLENDCADELQSADFENGQYITPNAQIFAVYLQIYLAIPTRLVICSKNSTGGYSFEDVEFQAQNYVQNITKRSTTSSSVHYFPPDTLVSYSNATSMGYPTSVTLSKQILCRESYRNVAGIWMNYTQNTTFKNEDYHQLISDKLDWIKGNWTTQCVGGDGTTAPKNPKDSGGGSAGPVGGLARFAAGCLAVFVGLLFL